MADLVVPWPIFFETIETIEGCLELFRPEVGDETIPRPDETIFRLPCRTLETTHGYQPTNNEARRQAGRDGVCTASFLRVCFRDLGILDGWFG